MNATTLRTLCLLAALCLLSGCSYFRETWKDTRKLYKEYVNTPTKLTIPEQPKTVAPITGDLKLAKLFMPADERLEALSRLFSAQDLQPPLEWCRDLLGVYPWLSGVAVVSDSGDVVYKYPEVDVIPTDFSQLLEFKKRYLSRMMTGGVTVTELGSLVYLATPLFQENDFHGILVAYFEPRALANFSPNPGDLIMVASEGVLWAGNDDAGARTLAGEKWKDILKGNVSGSTSAGGSKYIWQARFVGNKPIIYLTNANTPFVAVKQTDEIMPDSMVVPEAPAPTPPPAPQPKPEKQPKAKKAAEPKAKAKPKPAAKAEPAQPAQPAGESVQPDGAAQPEAAAAKEPAKKQKAKPAKAKIQEKTIPAGEGAAPAKAPEAAAPVAPGEKQPAAVSAQ